MTSYSLEVTFDGLAAWVPKVVANKLAGYFVLWPDAQFAERAYWIKPDNNLQPHVREPHQALLLVNYDDLVSGEKPAAVVSDPENKRPLALFLIDRRQVRFKDLPQAPLTFAVTGSQWSFQTLPHMAEISPRHRRVRADLNPAAGNFGLAKSGLAGFLAITGGNLAVTQLFDSGRELHFARVKSRSGELGFGRVVKKAPVGNQVLWKTPLADKQVTVVLERRDGAVEVVVKADPVARLRLVNAELEVPVLRKTDPFSLPKGKSRFPDPDFGVYYPLSASASTKGRRVAVGTGTPVGSREKPCAPAVFAGFGEVLE